MTSVLSLIANSQLNLHFGNTSALLSQFCQNFPFSHSFFHCVRSQSDPEALLRFHHHHLERFLFFKALKKDKEQTL